MIRNVLNRFEAPDYDRLLDLLNEKTIRLLGAYNRDHAVSIIGRILFAQPRLLAFRAAFVRPILEKARRTRRPCAENFLDAAIRKVGSDR